MSTLLRPPLPGPRRAQGASETHCHGLTANTSRRSLACRRWLVAGLCLPPTHPFGDRAAPHPHPPERFLFGEQKFFVSSLAGGWWLGLVVCHTHAPLWGHSPPSPANPRFLVLVLWFLFLPACNSFLSLAFDVRKQSKADMAYRSRAHRHPAHPPPPARAPPRLELVERVCFASCAPEFIVEKTYFRHVAESSRARWGFVTRIGSLQAALSAQNKRTLKSRRRSRARRPRTA